jgi:hypothetical protein
MQKSCRFAQIVGQVQDFIVSSTHPRCSCLPLVLYMLSKKARNSADFALLYQHFVDALANAFGSPAQMHFQNLTDVHTRRYTQWVQYDVYGTAICHVRHVFYWQDARNHTFVTVSTRHFVTRLANGV